MINNKISASGGYIAYVPGGGNIYGAIADMISSMINRYTTITLFCPSLCGMDKQVIKWLCDTVGYKNSLESGGILVSGGSMANFMSVLCARQVKLKDPENYPKGIVYGSDHTHHSFVRGCYLGGIPKKKIKMLPTSIQGNFEINFKDLENQIEEDLKDNNGVPVLLICNLGTTNTGKIENIAEYVRIAKKFDLWLHADGCYGACFTLLEEYKDRYFSLLDNFDSISIDPHKGFFAAYGLGAFLIKDWKNLIRTFSYKGDDVAYYPATSEETDDYLNSKLLSDMFDMGIENSRDFKALKLWLPLKIVGTNTFKNYLEEKLSLANFFYNELKKETNIQIISQNLTITIFRYHNEKNNKTFEEINDINKEFLTQINSYGNIIISQTLLKDDNYTELMFVCRVCILSVRTHIDEIMCLLKNIKSSSEIIKNKYYN